MKKALTILVLLIPACILLPGCAQNAVKKELLSLLENPGTARGSDLMVVLCGWPTYEKLHPDTIDVEITPGSGLRSGSGTAAIRARNTGITCSGKIDFTYSPVYMGGHGSGGTELSFGAFEREDTLPAGISDPRQSRPIAIGSKTGGRLSEKSLRLPDGSFGDYYALEIVKPGSMIRIRLEGEKGLNPKGCLYQDNKLMSTFISSQFSETLSSTSNVICVDRGTVVLLVTAGKQTGRFSLMAEEVDAATRSMLKPCRR